MRIRQLTVHRFRGIETLTFEPGARTLILGPQNSGKSTVLEALDLLLHHGMGRPRPGPTEIEYFRRVVDAGFEIQATLGDLNDEFIADIRDHLEGWSAADRQIVAQPDGPGIEPVVRVRVRGTADLTFAHDYAKPESEGIPFGPSHRAQVGWVFDGRTRDPLRQLSFYQGGILDRLFRDANLDPATDALREALRLGAQRVGEDAAIVGVLGDFAEDLRHLGLLQGNDLPSFEAGAVSQRQLLQTLRLTLSDGTDPVPLARQGRGVQRLFLVAALLKIARGTQPDRQVIAGFEEPEEALEPLRQTQLAEMLLRIADGGGQIFVVTHSPEIARRFEIDDFLLLNENTHGHDALPLTTVLTPPVRQAYERRLDGTVVKGLFARIALLVEGPGDRAVFDVFWRALAHTDRVRPADEIGMEVLNVEGAQQMPMMAELLRLARKHVAVWAELDTPDVRRTVDRLRDEGNCGAFIMYGDTADRHNLEQALSTSCTIAGLTRAMHDIASDRGYGWRDQQNDLLSRCNAEAHEAIAVAPSLEEALEAIPEVVSRSLIGAALGSKSTGPFDLKGGRQARIFASSIVAIEGVPESFERGLGGLYDWIQIGCHQGVDVQMWSEV